MSGAFAAQESGEIFCPHCGAAVAEGDNCCWRCGEGLPKGHSWCPECGRRFAGGEERCPNCGTATLPGDPPPARRHTEGGKRRQNQKFLHRFRLFSCLRRE